MKFTIRDLFLVTVIVALGMGWWVDRSHLRHEMSKMRYRIVIGGPSVAEHKVIPDNGIPIREVAPGRYVGEMPNSSATTPNSPSRDP
jgi:hypothetical protein